MHNNATHLLRITLIALILAVILSAYKIGYRAGSERKAVKLTEKMIESDLPQYLSEEEGCVL